MEHVVSSKSYAPSKYCITGTICSTRAHSVSVYCSHHNRFVVLLQQFAPFTATLCLGMCTSTCMYVCYVCSLVRQVVRWWEPEVMENMQLVYPASLNNEKLTEREWDLDRVCGREKRVCEVGKQKNQWVRGREGERRVMKSKTSFYRLRLPFLGWKNHISVCAWVCVACISQQIAFEKSTGRVFTFPHVQQPV